MARPATIVGDLGLAGALAGVMTFGWAMRGGGLPDTDDAARLQQIRDWLGGQAFGDVSQHRFGIDGVPMHWSRLPDLVPAALLKAGLGEPAMLILWPAALFAALLFLSARLARAVGARPVDAAILAALAYPATALFAPGRIDHHGLQMVLLALLALGLVRPAAGWGAVAGLAAALSLAIGMETAPLIALAAAILTLRWIRETDDHHFGAFAVALLIALAGLAATFAPADWASAPCDGFARASWRAGTIGGIALASLAAAGLAVRDTRQRLGLAVLVAIGAGIALIVAAPGCLSPYGAVDPALARRWLRAVGEAQPLLAADPRWAIAYAGVGVTALAAAAFAARRAEPLVLAALVAGGIAIAFVQLRGAYAAAALAPSLIALAIARARAAAPLAALPLWIAGAGIVWPLAASLLPGRTPPTGASCTDAAQARRMRALPPGRVLGPVDLGPWLLVETRHHAIAAPYHRNAAGNFAAWRLFAAPPAAVPAIAREVRADYVVACPAALTEMSLKSGWTPRGLAPTPVANVWRVR